MNQSATILFLFTGGPHFVRTMPPQFVSSQGANIALSCDAVSDEMLDVAYIWTHNGLPISDLRNELIRIVS